MKRAICKRRAVALDSIDHIINELRDAKKRIDRAVIPKRGQRTLVSGDVSLAMSKLSETRDNVKDHV